MRADMPADLTVSFQDPRELRVIVRRGAIRQPTDKRPTHHEPFVQRHIDDLIAEGYIVEDVFEYVETDGEDERGRPSVTSFWCFDVYGNGFDGTWRIPKHIAESRRPK